MREMRYLSGIDPTVSEMLPDMRLNLKSTGLYRLYNLKSEDARGRCVMLASSVTTNIINWLTGSLFYTSFLMANGIDLVKIGIISFIPYIANLFSIFSPSILERFPRRRWVLFFGRFAYFTLNILAVTVMPHFVRDSGARTVLFVILTLSANIVSALFSSGYTAWHLNFIPHRIRAEYFTTSSMIASFVGIGVSLISSLTADAFSASPHADAIIAAFRYAAYAIGLIEIWILSRPVEYPYGQTVDRVRLSDIITKPLSRPKFMITMAVIVIWTFFINTSAASINYYLLNNVGVTYTLVYGLNMLYPVTMLFLIRPVQKLIARFGWFRVFAWSAVLYAVPCFMHAFVTASNYAWLYTAVRIFQHIVGVALNTTFSNLPFINMPDSDRTDYLSFHTLSTNAAAFLGMLCGTLFVKYLPDISVSVLSFPMCGMQLLMVIESAGRVLTGLTVLKLGKKVEPDL